MDSFHHNLRVAREESLRHFDDGMKMQWSYRESDVVARMSSVATGTPFQRKVWAALNSRLFRVVPGFKWEGWMDFPATVLSDALSAAGLLDKHGYPDRRSIAKLHQAAPTARRLVDMT